MFCHLKYITVSGVKKRFRLKCGCSDNLISGEIAQSLRVVIPSKVASYFPQDIFQFPFLAKILKIHKCKIKK